MTRSGPRQLVAFAGGLTLAVGALAGLVVQMVFPLDASASLLEARIGWTVALILLAVLVLLYVALPVGAAVILAREHGNPVVYGATALAAILVPVLTPVGLVWLLQHLPTIGSLRFVAGAGAFVTLLAGAVLAASRVGPSTDGTVWVFGLNLAVVCVFLVGFLGVQVVAPGFAAVHTVEYGGFGGPHAQFEFEERSTPDGTVLVVEHAGGDPLVADNVRIVGEGFADVDGVDRTEPGPWTGETSGERPRRGGTAVSEDDSTTVGVARECRIRVTYRTDETARTLALHECTD